MQTLKIFSIFSALMMLLFSLPTISSAQTKTETIPVSGNCGMCKSKIEKAAKTAGVDEAKWDSETKVITVKYNSSATNAAKIQESIAAVGYDTRDVKASDEAYKKLHACCQYERSTTGTGDAKMDCCKDGKCSKHGQGSDKDCCKDGKCSKPGHDGKDCCKQAH